MPNLFSEKSAEALCQTLVNLQRVVKNAPKGKYPFSDADLSAALAAQSAAQSAIDSQQSADLLMRSATQAKAAGKGQCVSILNALAAQATATASLSDADLAAIGFAPRRSTAPRPAIPQVPAGLTLEGFSDSTLVARWLRGTNPRSTTFVLEVSLDQGASWTMAWAGPRVGARLEGYAPGVAVWARVSASNAGRTSGPSLPASVYAPASAPALRVVQGRAA